MLCAATRWEETGYGPTRAGNQAGNDSAACTAGCTFVVNAIFERHVDRVVFPVANADLVHISGARKELVAILVKGHGHDTVCGEESLLHAITVVNVDIYVQNPGVVPVM